MDIKNLKKENKQYQIIATLITDIPKEQLYHQYEGWITHGKIYFAFYESNKDISFKVIEGDMIFERGQFNPNNCSNNEFIGVHIFTNDDKLLFIPKQLIIKVETTHIISTIEIPSKSNDPCIPGHVKEKIKRQNTKLTNKDKKTLKQKT